MNDEQLERYSRQIMLPEFDYSGQMALCDSKVLIIGIGGLGSPAALYLASSGVGEITLVDDDTVDLSNLSRQIIHTTDDIGVSKTESAKASILSLNPNVNVRTINARISQTDLLTECINADVVLDCTDRFSSRFGINQACVDAKTKLVSAAALKFDGQLSSYDFSDNNSPCYQCLYSNHDDSTDSCAENGILSPIVGVMGVLQALEVIKIISGLGQTLNGKLMIFNGLDMSFRIVKLKKDKCCKICNDNI